VNITHDYFKYYRRCLDLGDNATRTVGVLQRPAMDPNNKTPEEYVKSFVKWCEFHGQTQQLLESRLHAIGLLVDKYEATNELICIILWNEYNSTRNKLQELLRHKPCIPHDKFILFQLEL